MKASPEVTVMKVAGLFKDNKCGTIALAIAIGAMRFVVISETMEFVLVDDGSLKKPISIFPETTKTLSRPGKAWTSLCSFGSMACTFSTSNCKVSRPFRSDFKASRRWTRRPAAMTFLPLL